MTINPALIPWSVLIGLSLIACGGFVLWTYGTRPREALPRISGPEAEEISRSHTRHVRWFLIYGAVCLLCGLLMLTVVRFYIIAG